MAINDDFDWLYSGNGTAAGSLGGAITNVVIPTSTDQNLFRNVTDVSVDSDQYYCVYIKNISAQSHNVGLFISTPTPSQGTKLYIGLGTSAKNTAEQVIPDNATEPAGILWLQRHFEYNPMIVGTLNTAEYKSIWLRLHVSAGAGGTPMDYVRLKLVEV
jgi:hypothetical protein